MATKNGFAPSSPVGPGQPQVPQKAPCYGGQVVVKNGSMLGTAEEADGLLLTAEGSNRGCPPGLLFVPKN